MVYDAVANRGKHRGMGAERPESACELPENVAKLEHDQLIQAINLLSKGEFTEAEKLLKPLAVPEAVRVYGSWATIPIDLRERFRQAAMEAVQNWNTALGGSPRIEWTDDERDADVQIVFEEDVAEITAGQFRLMHGRARLFLPPQSGRPSARARTDCDLYALHRDAPVAESRRTSGWAGGRRVLGAGREPEKTPT
jgi:hypothetical protein